MNRLLSCSVAIATIAAVGTFPSEGRCQVLIVEMTTAAILNPATSVSPSSNSFSLPDLNASGSTAYYLPDVVHAHINGNYDYTKGVVNLDFLLTIGSQTIPGTGKYDYSSWSQVSGPGARGASSSLYLRGPMVFNFDVGTVRIYSSYGRADPPTWPATDHLTLYLTYVPVPEPSTLLLLGIGAISLLGYRKAKSYG